MVVPPTHVAQDFKLDVFIGLLEVMDDSTLYVLMDQNMVDNVMNAKHNDNYKA